MEEDAAIRKTGRSTGEEQTGGGLRYLPLKEFARKALWDTVMLSGLAFIERGKPGAAGRVTRIWAHRAARGTCEEFAEPQRAACGS